MRKRTGRKTDKKKIVPGLLLLAFLGLACVLVYKAQIRGKLDEPIQYTMMTEHKATSEVILSSESSQFSQVFQCMVPELRSFSIELGGQKVESGATLAMRLYDADTDETYYQEEQTVKSVISSRTGGKAEFVLPQPLLHSEGRRLCLTWTLHNAKTTLVVLTADQKQILVSSFNGTEGDRTNVIYTLSYGDSRSLFSLYILLCEALLTFAALCWELLMIRRVSVERFFVPAALFLGLIFQCIFTPGSVPDESGHLDTAYRYSNKILLVQDTGNPQTIYKRVCDAQMSDMLANGLESNSYYQLMTRTFSAPGDTELTEVASLDYTSLVPGLVYYPAALGLAAGRLLGLSAMLTLQLARIFSLIVFVVLVWIAIRLAPFGKNLLAMLAMLPITLQEGASFSYDAMVNGLFMLFTALCFRMWREGRKKAWEAILAVLLALFAAVTKGGVYLPLLLLLLPALWRSGIRKSHRKKKALWLVLGAGAGALLLVLLTAKFMPVFQTFLQEIEQTEENALYTVPYLMRHPQTVAYLYWNTIMKKGDMLLNGLLGGVLSWLDFEMNGIFQMVFLICLLLLANQEREQYRGSPREKLLMLASCAISVAFVMMSMLVGYTKVSSDYIQGLQGRYFLPLAFPLFCLTANQMVLVKENQRACIWMTAMATEVLLVLQVAAMV